jgi:hypothetical protein
MASSGDLPLSEPNPQHPAADFDWAPNKTPAEVVQSNHLKNQHNSS